MVRDDHECRVDGTQSRVGGREAKRVCDHAGDRIFRARTASTLRCQCTQCMHDQSTRNA